MNLLSVIKRSFVLVSVLFLYSCSSMVDMKNDAISSLVLVKDTKGEDYQEIVVQDIKPIKIALLVPTTGTYQDIGKSIIDAFQLALYEHKYYFVEVRVYNTEGDTIKNIAKKVVKDKADIVVGPLFVEKLQDMAGIIPKNIPIITFSNNLNVVKNLPNAYTITESPLIGMFRSVSYVKSVNKVEKVALLIPDNFFGDIIEQDVNRVLNSYDDIELIKVVRYKTNKVNFNYDVRKLIETPRQKDQRYSSVDFDALIIGDFGNRVFLLTSQFLLLDINPSEINIIGTSQWDSMQNKMLTMKDKVLANSYYPSTNMRNFEGFTNKFLNIYKQEPNRFAAISYDIANMVLSFIDYDKETYKYTFNLNSTTLLGYESQNAVLGNFKFHPERFAIKSLNVKQVFANGSAIVVNRDEGLDYLNKQEDNSEEDMNNANQADSESIGNIVKEIQSSKEDNSQNSSNQNNEDSEE